MVENAIQIKSGITINVDMDIKIRENIIWKKQYLGCTCTCTCENGKYLESINDDSVTTYDKTIEATKTVLAKIIP